jgi:hypothetical protein
MALRQWSRQFVTVFVSRTFFFLKPESGSAGTTKNPPCQERVVEGDEAQRAFSKIFELRW